MRKAVEKFERVIARFHDWRAKRLYAAAIRHYHHDSDVDRATRRLIKAAHRYDTIKKTSEKFFRKARGAI